GGGAGGWGAGGMAPSTARATPSAPPWNAAACSIALEIMSGRSMISPGSIAGSSVQDSDKPSEADEEGSRRRERSSRRRPIGGAGRRNHTVPPARRQLARHPPHHTPLPHQPAPRHPAAPTP